MQTQLNQRYQMLDFIRGISIMGILIMNVQSFGHLFASYFNPTVNSDFSGFNLATWYVTHIFFEQKFYTLFSMLFGAGIVIMAEGSVKKGISPAATHYRRNIYLFIFGLLHAFFIWYGDILNTYALWAFLVYLVWQKPAKILLVTGFLSVLSISMLILLGAFFIEVKEASELQKNFIPDQTMIDSIIAAYQGSWSQQFQQRTDSAVMMISQMAFFGLKIAGCMLIGMGLYKLGILNGLKTVQYYKKMTFFCLTPGLALVVFGANQLTQNGFVDAVQTQMVLTHYNYWGSLLMALGYIGLFHWLYLSGNFNGIKNSVEAVGRMALTNYISQSIICTSIFYGFGLGWFAQLERFELIYVAILVLIVQIIWSKWWLNRFYFGPFEWLWRSLTYVKLQSFKRKI